MKESYERKVQDLQKVKMQNIQLLSIAGTPEYYFLIISSFTLVHAEQILLTSKLKLLRFICMLVMAWHTIGSCRLINMSVDLSHPFSRATALSALYLPITLLFFNVGITEKAVKTFEKTFNLL
jgi:hypothetical protein